MPTVDLQHLDYGFIYVIGDPKQTANLRWFAHMIEPMIRPLSLQWVETSNRGHTIIAARRFNVANLEKYATLQLHLNPYGRSDSYSLLAGVHAFSDCLQDVMDTSEGDVILHEQDYSDRNEPPGAHGTWGMSTSSLPLGSVFEEYDMDAIPQDHTRVVMHPRPSRGPMPVDASFDENDVEMCSKSAKREPPQRRSRIKEAINKTMDKVSRRKKGPDAPEDLEVEEVLEFRRIETEYERDMRDLRARIVAFIAKYHQDPHEVMTTMLEGKVLLGTTPSHLLVNGDLKVVLPEYDEMEIQMPAMCRTLYILFMKCRLATGGGIVLKDIGQYRDDIIDIYSLVKPGASEDRVERSVDNLCDPQGDSLNQAISRINRCIRNVITDENLARQYTITGARGEEYTIGLDPSYLTLPRAVTA